MQACTEMREDTDVMNADADLTCLHREGLSPESAWQPEPLTSF